ncbi:MAG: hypothetical protein FWH22_01530, partial [Fibromonadales bacterium]|nr:hypothetical protein [Fibromonadales bacterium]
MDITGNKFCFNGKPEEKCGNKEYNPSREFCFKSKAYDICGFNQYDPDEQDCFNNAVYWITGCSASEDVKFCSKDGTKIINYGVCELSELMYNVEKQ